MRELLNTAAIILAVTAASPAAAMSFRMDCVAARPDWPANNPLGKNEGSDEIRVIGRVDGDRRGYVIDSVTGTSIIRTGFSPFTSADDTSVFSKIDWRSPDGLSRYYGIQLQAGGALNQLSYRRQLCLDE